MINIIQSTLKQEKKYRTVDSKEQRSQNKWNWPSGVVPHERYALSSFHTDQDLGKHVSVASQAIRRPKGLP